MKNFSLIGAAGYIAPRHFQAIKDCNGRLISAYDPTDSVGILDSVTLGAKFFKNFEQYHYFNKYESDENVDYVSVCSPNYLHKSHIAHSLNLGAEVICEKPLVLTLKELDEVEECENAFEKNVYTILQLRLHEQIIALKNQIDSTNDSERYEIDLCYITSRGPWYSSTWKNNDALSGGLATNIGIHFFDMLTWIFGKSLKNELHVATPTLQGGYLELERANVRWMLSIDSAHLPDACKARGIPTFRSIKIGDQEVEFSGGFADLHKKAYHEILKGNGFRASENREALGIVENIRNTQPTGRKSYSHGLIQGM